MHATRRQIEMADSWEDPLAPMPEESAKPKYPRLAAIAVADEILPALRNACEPSRLMVCGSLRRGRAMVGDAEIVFVPRMRQTSAEVRDLFGNLLHEPAWESAAAVALQDLLDKGVLAKRLKKDGTQTWGQWNCLAVHVASGIPVDFFACLECAWWNTLVSRTGGARSNLAIATAAKAKGWHWEPKPSAPGFQRGWGLGVERHAVDSEEAVFSFVGLPYKQPFERE